MCLPYHLTGRLFPLLALFQTNQNSVRNDNGVVHQHPQRQNERAQGDFLKFDVQKIHADERRQNREHQENTDEHAALDSHEEHQKPDDDPDGFDEVHHELIDRLRHDVALIIDRRQLHAEGKGGLQCDESLLYGSSHGDHIPPGDDGNAETDGGLSVEPQHVPGRLLVSPGDGGHITQPNQSVPAAEAKVRERFLADEISRGSHADIFLAHIHLAALLHEILRLQRQADTLGRNSQFGEARSLELNIEHFLLCSPKADLGHTLTEQKLVFQKFRVVLELRIGEPFTGKREKQAVNIPEIVVHHGGPRSGG